MFSKFLSQTTPKERHTSLLKQYHSLIHLELPSVSTFGTLADMLIPLWITYNLRQQLEMLLLIILTTSQIELSLNDVDKLIELLQVIALFQSSFFVKISKLILYLYLDNIIWPISMFLLSSFAFNCQSTCVTRADTLRYNFIFYSGVEHRLEVRVIDGVYKM